MEDVFIFLAKLIDVVNFRMVDYVVFHLPFYLIHLTSHITSM